MSSKFCFNCHFKVAMDVMECPECNAKSFLHKDPAIAAAEEELAKRSREQLRNMTPGDRTDTHWNWDQEEEIAKIARISAEKAMDPEKLEAFKKRLQKELEELEYLEWRSHQPGWKDPEVQQRWKNITATAAGVAIGTSVLRSQLGMIQNNFSRNDSSDTGGIGNWLGDLFN